MIFKIPLSADLSFDESSHSRQTKNAVVLRFIPTARLFLLTYTVALQAPVTITAIFSCGTLQTGNTGKISLNSRQARKAPSRGRINLISNWSAVSCRTSRSRPSSWSLCTVTSSHSRETLSTLSHEDNRFTRQNETTATLTNSSSIMN